MSERSQGAQVGALLTALAKIDEQEQAEIATAPQSIRGRHEERRIKARAKYSAEVVEMAEKARAK